MTIEQSGSIVLKLGREVTIDGHQVTSLSVDLGTKEITPEYEGLPKGEKIPVLGTTEYIIIFRDDQGREVASTKVAATI